MKEIKNEFTIKYELVESQILYIFISGIIDKTNKEKFLENILENASIKIPKIIIDFSELKYLSPSGLEILDFLSKKMINKWENINLQNIPEIVWELINRYGINSKIKLENITKKVSINTLDINNKKVLVFSENELLEIINKDDSFKTYGCISIRNPNEEIPIELKNYFSIILEQKYYDAYDINHLGPEQRIKRIPEKKDIQEIINFYKQTEKEVSGYIIHCWHGLSRSPAVALGLLYLINNSELKAKKLLRDVRPSARPHMLIVKYFDELIKTNLLTTAKVIRDEALNDLKIEINGI